MSPEIPGYIIATAKDYDLSVEFVEACFKKQKSPMDFHDQLESELKRRRSLNESRKIT